MSRNNEKKQTSRNLSLTKKLEIIQQIEKGEKIFDVHKRLGIPFAAVINIWKCRDQIKHYLDYKARLEEALLSWCLEQKKKNTPLGEPHIKMQAKKIAKAMNFTNFNLKDKWVNDFINEHGDYLVITDTQSKIRTIIKNFQIMNSDDQGSAIFIQEGNSGSSSKLDTVINTSQKEKKNVEKSNSASPIIKAENPHDEITYGAAEQVANNYEEQDQTFFVLDEKNAEFLVVKEDDSGSEEENQRGYSECLSNIKEEIRDDIEDDQKSTIKPPSALFATTNYTSISEQPTTVSVGSPSIHSVQSFIQPDTSSALYSKSTSDSSLSPPTYQFSPIASSSTASEPPPTIQEALDAVDVLGRFLSICGEDPIVCQRLKEILGLGKS